LKFLVIILLPAVWFSQFLTRLFKTDQKSVLSRADFHAMTDIGLKHGVFIESESEIIKNLLNFNSVQVKDIMTPRMVVVAADEDTMLQEFNTKHPDLHFSRIPIYKEKIDQVSGFVLKDEILLNLINGRGNTKLKELKRKIEVVPELVPIPELFKLLLEKNTHIAMVVDEHGGMEGIVTMEDIIETLLGLEIRDELDYVDDLQELARRNWEKRAKKMGLLKKT
jgi:CBS domain containing-hemolysin-like protein